MEGPGSLSPRLGGLQRLLLPISAQVKWSLNYYRSLLCHSPSHGVPRVSLVDSKDIEIGQGPAFYVAL